LNVPLGDTSTGSHANAWNDVRPLIETELSLCKNANCEFSTSCGECLSQLEYMDSKWTGAKIYQIFPDESRPTAAVPSRVWLCEPKGEARRKLIEVGTSPDGVSGVVRKMIEKRIPNYHKVKHCATAEWTTKLKATFIRP
jgi:hypothetical protein